MPVNQEAGTSRVFVVINARSGNASPDLVRKALESRRAEGAVDLQIHEPREGEDIIATVRQAVANGFETVVAAGGDGTVSAVANAVVGTPSRLGIIPLGTTNVLARPSWAFRSIWTRPPPAVWPEHDGDDRRHEGQYHELLHPDRHRHRCGHDSRHARRARRAAAGHRRVPLDLGDPAHRVPAASLLDLGEQQGAAACPPGLPGRLRRCR